MSISVIVGTFGDANHWGEIARRAVDSAEAQTVAPIEVIRYHADNLRDARNGGAHSARGEWLCFLDADDELDCRYIETMTAALPDNDMLLQPATLGIVNGIEDREPVVIAPKRLLDGNYLVIGTVVRRDQFLRVGGFADWPIYEDWDLWLRCWIDGARSIPVSGAVYRVHVRTHSRNNADRATQIRYYNLIRGQYLGRIA